MLFNLKPKASNMSKFIKLLFLVFALGISQHAFSQAEGGGEGDKKKMSPKSERAKRRKDKAKWKEARKKKREDEKAVKQHHKRIQTKDVQKRMKKNRRRSAKQNTKK